MEPEESLPAVLRGETDVAVAHEYDVLPRPLDPLFERRELCSDPAFAAVPADGPAAGDGEVDLRSLAGQPFLAPRVGTSCAEMIQRACARAGFVPRVVARHRLSRPAQSGRGRRRGHPRPAAGRLARPAAGRLARPAAGPAAAPGRAGHPADIHHQPPRRRPQARSPRRARCARRRSRRSARYCGLTAGATPAGQKATAMQQAAAARRESESGNVHEQIVLTLN
jgi:hypothetical protein